MHTMAKYSDIINNSDNANNSDDSAKDNYDYDSDSDKDNNNNNNVKDNYDYDRFMDPDMCECGSGTHGLCEHDECSDGCEICYEMRLNKIKEKEKEHVQELNKKFEEINERLSIIENILTNLMTNYK